MNFVFLYLFASYRTLIQHLLFLNVLYKSNDLDLQSSCSSVSSDLGLAIVCRCSDCVHQQCLLYILSHEINDVMVSALSTGSRCFCVDAAYEYLMRVLLSAFT